jgi:2-oxoisovalerate ferredoxin oxidoreductase beta subunit
LIEVLSPCPTGWGLQPTEALGWVKENLAKYFPLGVLKDESANREGWTRYRDQVPAERIPEILGLGARDGEEAFEHFAPPEVATCYRNPRIKIAGFGGQGVLFLGKLLAESGMRQGYRVSGLPSYGPEMRGGTANCHVNISTEVIGSPLVSDPTVLFAFNRPSLDKFEQEVASGGLIIYDSSLIDIAPVREDVEVIALPATQIADEIGSAKASNMVALGAYVGRTNLLDRSGLVKAVESVTKKRALLDLNLKAIEAGAKFAREQSDSEIQ